MSALADIIEAHVIVDSWRTLMARQTMFECACGEQSNGADHAAHVVAEIAAAANLAVVELPAPAQSFRSGHLRWRISDDVNDPSNPDGEFYRSVALLPKDIATQRISFNAHQFHTPETAQECAVALLAAARAAEVQS